MKKAFLVFLVLVLTFPQRSAAVLRWDDIYLMIAPVCLLAPGLVTKIISEDDPTSGIATHNSLSYSQANEFRGYKISSNFERYQLGIDKEVWGAGKASAFQSNSIELTDWSTNELALTAGGIGFKIKYLDRGESEKKTIYQVSFPSRWRINDFASFHYGTRFSSYGTAFLYDVGLLLDSRPFLAHGFFGELGVMISNEGYHPSMKDHDARAVFNLIYSPDAEMKMKPYR